MIESVQLTNKTTLQSIVIDQYESNFVLDEIDLGVVNGTHHSYKYLNQIGAHIDSTTLEPRVISITGWVIGSTYDLMEQNKQILNGLINPLHHVEAQVLDKYKITFKPDYSIKYSTGYVENNEVLTKFLIQGTCEDPLFTSLRESTIPLATTYPKFKFPLIIPQNQGILFGLRESSLIMNVINEGQVDTGMVITFSCSSEVVNPSITNISTGEYFKFNKTLSPGEIVVVSTLSGSKGIKGIIGEFESSYFRYLDLGSTWLTLHPGDNLLKYNADQNPQWLEVSISFYNKYLEVQ